MPLTPEQLAAVERQRIAREAQLQEMARIAQTLGVSDTSSSVPGARGQSIRALAEAYNQHRNSGRYTGTLEQWITENMAGMSSGDPTRQGTPNQPGLVGAPDTGLLGPNYPQPSLPNQATRTPGGGLPVSEPAPPGSPPPDGGLPVSVPAPPTGPNVPARPREPGTRIDPTTGMPVDMTPPPGTQVPRPVVVPGQTPNFQTPGGPMGGFPGYGGELAAYGLLGGPNGEILPAMLRGGWNPHQATGLNPQINGFDTSQAGGLLMPQLGYDPNIGGPGWIPGESVGPIAPTGGQTPPGAAGPGAPGTPPTPGPTGTRPYYGEGPRIDMQMAKSLLGGNQGYGLLGMPPALAGLLK